MNTGISAENLAVNGFKIVEEFFSRVNVEEGSKGTPGAWSREGLDYVEYTLVPDMMRDGKTSIRESTYDDQTLEYALAPLRPHDINDPETVEDMIRQHFVLAVTDNVDLTLRGYESMRHHQGST
ncbi:MAG: hypothetical protein RDV48_23625 [Candidatus Eremiobacteraeota bacterium]|nr:hypothetical protein [Candidatus Eremiobacteraeota bacterium]